MNYRISKRADRDIEEICDRIALDNPSAAEKLDLKLHDQIKILADMPAWGISARGCRR
jgi:plasmid stabilization system protein ParE